MTRHDKAVSGAPYNVKSYNLSHSRTLWLRVRQLEQFRRLQCVPIKLVLSDLCATDVVVVLSQTNYDTLTVY